MALADRMPSIVFLNRFYWPDESATAQILRELCVDLAAAGWSVTVIASGGTYRVAQRELPAREEREGVTIRRILPTGFGALGLLGRALDYAKYALGATWDLVQLDRADFVVAMTDPPMMIVPALFAARIKGSRCIYWMQDMFPQMAARLGFMSETGVLYRVLRGIAATANRRADLVLALGDRMAEEAVRAGARAGRVAVAPNWTDLSTIALSEAAANPFVREHGLEGKFVVMYSGNAGRAHTFDSVLGAADLLADDDRIVFLFVGGGPVTPRLKEAAASSRGHIRFLGYVAREQLRYSLAAASVSLVTENPAVVGLLVPSKAYSILASGRPILYIGSADSDIGRLVVQHECGLVFDASDASGLASGIRALADDSDRVRRLGANARRTAAAYDRPVSTARWRAAVHGILPGGSATQSRALMSSHGD